MGRYDNVFPKIWILKAEIIDNHCYLIALFQIEFSEITIRFGIDYQSYIGIKKIIQDRIFEKTLLSEYRFRLLTGHSSWSTTKEIKHFIFWKKKIKIAHFGASIEVTLKRQTKDVHFECSDIFIGHIEWLKSITDINELMHVKYSS